MSRVLTRPMFRLGGSASGITSGLDSAKLNASRKNFSNGGDAYKEGLRNRVTAAKEVLDEFSPQQRGMMPGSVSSFLTNFGLNLLSQSPTGNIFSTAATAAKQPFQQFQGVRAAEVEQQRRLNQAILGDAMETLSEEKQAQHEGKKSYDPGAAAKIADLTEKSYLRQLELTKRQEELEAKEILTEAEEDEGYLYTGAEEIVKEGDPVPLLYGKLRVQGQPISIALNTTGSSGQFVISGTNTGHGGGSGSSFGDPCTHLQ